MRKIGLRSLEDLDLAVEKFWHAYVDRLLVTFFLKSSTEKALNEYTLLHFAWDFSFMLAHVIVQ